MSFNIYFAGSGATEYKRQNNCNQLLSQINERAAIKNWVTYLREHPECKSKLFIDSGAYSVWTRGKEVDVDEYIKLLNSIDDVTECFAQVDKIPGEKGRTPTEEEKAAAPDQSWNNYLYMVKRVKSPKKLVPIFHQFESWSALERMINYQYEDGSYIDYIGLSPQEKGVSKQSWIEFFTKCFDIIKNSDNPNVKTHAFGCTVFYILEMFPFYSSDSSLANLVGAFGQIMLVQGKERPVQKYITVSIQDKLKVTDNHYLSMNRASQEKVKEEVKRLGFDIDYVINNDDGEYRKSICTASIWDWALNYKCYYDKVKTQPQPILLW